MGAPAGAPFNGTMIIYLSLNEATEMGYVGKTTKTLQERWDRHLDLAKSGGSSAFYRALREWPEHVWTLCILQHCTDLEELAVAEGNWIAELDTLNPSVGYNTAFVESAETRLASTWRRIRSQGLSGAQH